MSSVFPARTDSSDNVIFCAGYVSHTRAAQPMICERSYSASISLSSEVPAGRRSMTQLLRDEAQTTASAPAISSAASAPGPERVGSAALCQHQGCVADCVQEALQAVRAGATTLKLKVWALARAPLM